MYDSLPAIPGTGTIGLFSSPERNQYVRLAASAKAYQAGIVRSLLSQRLDEQIPSYSTNVRNFTIALASYVNSLSGTRLLSPLELEGQLQAANLHEGDCIPSLLHKPEHAAASVT